MYPTISQWKQLPECCDRFSLHCTWNTELDFSLGNDIHTPICDMFHIWGQYSCVLLWAQMLVVWWLYHSVTSVETNKYQRPFGWHMDVPLDKLVHARKIIGDVAASFYILDSSEARVIVKLTLSILQSSLTGHRHILFMLCILLPYCQQNLHHTFCCNAVWNNPWFGRLAFTHAWFVTVLKWENSCGRFLWQIFFQG